MKLTEISKTTPRIFCDIDGVLSNYVKNMSSLMGEKFSDDRYEEDPEYADRMWKALNKYQQEGGEFWFELEPMEDAKELWDYIKEYNPEILSSVGENAEKPTGPDQKRRWIRKHISDSAKVNIVHGAVNKAKYAKDGDILIDDKPAAIAPWKKAGGVGILHTSAADTIKQLKKLGL